MTAKTLNTLFADLDKGVLSVDFLSTVKPCLQVMHEQHVSLINASDASEFDFHGVKLGVAPGVYRPGVSSSSAFTFRGMLASTQPGQFNTLLELGTGSGAIGLALAKHGRIKKSAFLTDINPVAVGVANCNAQHNQLQDLVVTGVSDVFAATKGMTFDAIVFNLPFYHPQKSTDQEGALSDVGAHVATRFFKEAPEYLNEGGVIWFTLANISDAELMTKCLHSWDARLVSAEYDAASGLFKYLYVACVAAQ